MKITYSKIACVPLKLQKGTCLNGIARNLFYGTSDYSANYSTLKEHDFICLISQKVLNAVVSIF